MPEDNVIKFSRKKEENNIDKVQYLTFKIAGETYGIELVKNKEIIKPPRITNVPNTEKYIMGVINMRGRIVPVIDLKKKLGLAISEEDKLDYQESKIIIVQTRDIMIGLMVDNIQEVKNISKEEIGGISEDKRGISQEFIKGVYTHEDELVILINLDEVLFGKNERKKEIKNA